MDESFYPDINRAALVIKLKKPFIDWLVYTSKEYDGPGRELKPEEIKTDGFDSKHVYLIPAYDEIEKYEKYIKKHCTEIFEEELFGWYTDPEMWPKDRSWRIFQEWSYMLFTAPIEKNPEYSVRFLILLAKLLMLQEKTNRKDAYMFRRVLDGLNSGEDLFIFCGSTR